MLERDESIQHVESVLDIEQECPDWLFSNELESENLSDKTKQTIQFMKEHKEAGSNFTEFPKYLQII